MKLDYKIIWVEDKIDTKPFLSLIEKVKSFLENEFFNVTVETAEDFEEFKDKYEASELFDLIITDLNLNESHGSQVIDFVRDEKHILTEILFYSANSELSNTRLVNNNRITFFQLHGQDYHKTLLKSILELISLTISKFQHIVTMRGMIMHETSSLDIQMDKIVKTQLRNPSLQKGIELLLEKIFDNITANATEKYHKAKRRKVKDILRDNVLFNSSQKVMALGEILNIIGEDDFTPSYIEEIVLIRNQFAHAELKKDEQGRSYFKVKGQEMHFDADLCRKIRNNINKHIKNISKLEENLIKHD